ncbi:MAG: hypothetical protein P8J50_18140 [Acidimicrobiales bacterium]|nr:hypothetical protein [Acidimicrobiales bacterium]
MARPYGAGRKPSETHRTFDHRAKDFRSGCDPLLQVDDARFAEALAIQQATERGYDPDATPVTAEELGLLAAHDPTDANRDERFAVVDIGAAEYIHEQLLAQRSEMAAILLISEDLDEVRQLADRIIVMFEGRVMGELTRQEAELEMIGLLMSGVDNNESAG